VSRGTGVRGPCFAGRPYIDPGAAGPFHEPDRPMFGFDRELGTLERAFYRHLLRAIDLDALFGLEQMLWCELQELELFTDDQVLDISNAILSRALERIAHDPRRSMKEGTIGPGGHLVEAPEAPHGNCPFCGACPCGGGADTDGGSRTGVRAGSQSGSQAGVRKAAS
jgi:hypothetical protein